MAAILIVPGLHDSGPDHWQTWFEHRLGDTRRVDQADWENPCLAGWAARVGEVIAAESEAVWIVAHSFGCLAAVRAGHLWPGRVRAALLVAPADPDRFGLAALLPQERLRFPSMIVASNDDPWLRAAVAQRWAGAWGSSYRNIGSAGHINVDSGHGPWPQGLAFFEELRRAALAPQL